MVEPGRSVSYLLHPHIGLNVTTSLKSCSASIVSWIGSLFWSIRFQSARSNVPITRYLLPTISGLRTEKIFTQLLTYYPFTRRSALQARRYATQNGGEAPLPYARSLSSVIGRSRTRMPVA